MKDNSIYYHDIPIKIGWLCPKCEHILSPYVESCPYCEVAHKEVGAKEYLKKEFEKATCNTCKFRDIGTVYASNPNPPKFMCKLYNKYEPLDREACDQYEPVTITSSASINFKPYGKDPEEIKADDSLSIFKQFKNICENDQEV